MPVLRRESDSLAYGRPGFSILDSVSCWSLVAGCWLLVAGLWSLVASRWSLVSAQTPHPQSRCQFRRRFLPTLADQRPAASGQRPAASDQRPATSNQRPATSDQRPATSNQPFSFTPPSSSSPPPLGQFHLLHTLLHIPMDRQPAIPPIVYAVMAGDLELVKKRISLGCDVNHVDKARSTALSQAVARNRLDMVQLLMAHGADVNLPDADGKTALSYIRTYDMVQYFGLGVRDEYTWIVDRHFAELNREKNTKARWDRLPKDFGPAQYDQRSGPYDETATQVLLAVGRRGPGGWSGEEYDIDTIACIGFACDGMVHDRELLVLSPRVATQRIEVEPHAIYLARAIFNAGKSRCGLVGGLSRAQSDALTALIAYRNRDVEVTIDGVGHFALNRDLEVFEGSVDLWNRPCELWIDSTSDAIPDDLAALASRIMRDQQPLLDGIGRMLRTECHDLHREWSDENEALDATRFAELAFPHILQIRTSGVVKFLCGGPFEYGGHGMAIVLAADGTWSADMSG